MRSAVVSPLLLFLAACAGEGWGPVFIEDFTDRSPELECSVVSPPGGPPAAVVRLKLVGDTLLVAVAEGDREIVLLDPDLTVRGRVRWEAEGPAALVQPVDVDLVGDTLLAVADRGRARLVLLDLQGAPRGALPLGFAPQRLLADGGGWLVTAVPLAPTQSEILYRVDGAAITGVGVTRAGITGVGLAPLHDAVPQLKALANTTVLERVRGGRVLVAHQYLQPVAHLVELPARGGGRAVIRDVPTPLPEGVASAVGYRPEPPFTDEAMRRMLTPVLEAAPDPAGGGILYLTRTGRMAGAAWEKALVRVDADMRHQASWILPVNVGPFAWLPARGEVVAVAEDERWYRCPVPAGGGA